jgi:threonine/homoserine/homoserine lactone efflux protein
VGSAIGDVLPLAIGVAISPVPIIAMVLILTSQRARSNGLAFLLGWVVGLFGVGLVVLFVADASSAADDSGEPATWVGWLLLALGVVLVALAIRQWRSRPGTGEEPPEPGWMTAIDQFTAIRSTLVGFVLAALNPKNTTLTIAAAAAIAAAGLSTGESVIVVAVFVLIGSIGLLIPLVIYFAMGDRAPQLLGELQHWMAIHNAAIMAVLFVVIGAKLIGNGISTIWG